MHTRQHSGPTGECLSVFLLYLCIHYWTAAADLAGLLLNAAMPLLPGLITKGVSMIKEWGVLPEDLTASLASVDWRSRLEQIIQALVSGVGNVAGTIVAAVASEFSGIVTALVPIAGAYIGAPPN